MTSNWPKIKLAEVLRRGEETIELRPNDEYREVTIRLWGKGVILRGIVKGSDVAASRRFIARRGQFILSRIDARNGAIGIVPDDLDGAIVSNDFPVFNIAADRLLPSFLGWVCKTNGFVKKCLSASEGTTNRVRLQEGKFLAMEIPLPPVAEQRRIVARIDELIEKINMGRGLQVNIDSQLNAMLHAAHHSIIQGAPKRPLSEVSPLTRRPVTVALSQSYPQVAVRSFGRGTFHKPLLNGNEITWQKPFIVKEGDLLVSNIKAWEGAIAVAQKEDDGRVGSHRYLTFVPIPGVATATFLCFHLLTPQGLYEVGEASPGSADRNRTLNSRKFLNILIPVPGYQKQIWFDTILGKATKVRRLRAEIVDDLDALTPSILDKAFRGEL